MGLDHDMGNWGGLGFMMEVLICVEWDVCLGKYKGYMSRVISPLSISYSRYADIDFI